MPELPEVENVVRGLRGRLVGQTVVRARLTSADLYRKGSRRVEWLRGSNIDEVQRVGKAICISLSAPRPPEQRVLVVHLGMTGKLVFPPTSPNAGIEVTTEMDLRHRHIRFVLQDNTELWYIDPRRFGYIFAGTPAGLRETLNIGPDPFELKPAAFARILKSRSAPIKSLLLNQKIVSGLGNIYVDELLFFTGIHPLVPAASVGDRAGDVLREARRVLRSAIKHGGTTFRDYRRPDGSRGGFQGRLAVYGRDGENCMRCSSELQRSIVGGRSTHHCPKCQPAPRRAR